MWTVHPSLGKLKRRQNKNHGAWALLPKDLIFIIQAWNMGLLVCFSDVQVALKCQFSLRTTSQGGVEEGYIQELARGKAWPPVSYHV